MKYLNLTILLSFHFHFHSVILSYENRMKQIDSFASIVFNWSKRAISISRTERTTSNEGFSCRFRVCFDGIVGTSFWNAGGTTADLCRGILHATVQRRMEVGRWQDQGSAGEREDGCLVAAARAARPSQITCLRFPRRPVVSARGGLPRRTDSCPTGLLRSRWKRGASW